MKTLAILIPTYKRPQDLATVAKSIANNTLNEFTIYFGLEKDDEAGFLAAKLTGHRTITNRYEPGYSNTIQTLYEVSAEPFLLHANDDFEFHQNWDETPMSMFTGNIKVVGMKQTDGDIHGSAISLFKREYIEKMSGVVDMPNRVFYPYNHNYVDTEFTQTAQKRNVWAMCEPRVITHKHPGFTGAEKDATHHKNDATVEKDRLTFESRQHLWQ